MGEWPVGVLKDLGCVVMGQSPPAATVNRVANGVPLLNGPTEFGQRHPLPEQWTVSPSRLAPAGATLFCVRGSTTGRMNIADQPYAIGRGLAAIMGSRPEETPFLRWALTWSLPRLLASVTGSVFPSLARPQIEDAAIPIPPPTQRMAIAEVLGALDNKIAANSRLAVAAEDLALVLAATATGGMRLRDLASYTRVMVAPDALDVSSVDLYSLPAYDAGRTPEHVAPDTIKSGKFALSGPSVLISKLNPRIPRIWQVSDVGDAPALASTEFVVLVPASASSAVLWALAMQPWVSESLQSQVAGTSGSHQRVKPADVLATRVADPATLSAAAHTQIESCATRAQAARIESSRLAATRDALLPALMSGALRVRDAEWAVSDQT